ncbi:M23 family metallopeptidase [Frigoribacterium sp. PvP032]|uniref:M23 family metallopeptidase n=1 Tax=Frigoribacterium sp. PvP032 TaxID=2806589 RepID=UPI001AE8715B|nr:M23 family metallopeptidase [Frigoribacterium sp. PvP032]MBP1190074.1 murein DD-endopeptidase MepM/ murein hydrolase activator NlpD [Frigoribacterium sp. PvP032]
MSKSHTIAEPEGDQQSRRAPVDQRDDAAGAPAQQVFTTRREAREAERRAAASVAAPAASAAPDESAPAVSLPAVSLPAVSAADAAPAQIVAPAPAAAQTATPAHATRAERRAAEAEAARRRGRRPAVSETASLPRATRSTARAAQRPVAALASRAAATPASAASPAPAPAATARPPAPAATARRKGSLRGAGKRVTVVGAMVFAGAMLVSTSVPANAFFVDTDERTVAKNAAASQTFVAGATAEAAASRDGYSVTEMKVAPVSEYASTSASTFSNDVAGTVQWPFATGVPISSGFGARHVSNCGFCSTFHNGLDFIPGAGSPIQAIADGTVSAVTGPGGAFGNHVEIEHVINGQKVTSTYSHMQTGSVQVSVGQTVTVGQLVGKVGSTGNSTGAHLHFEIHLGGVPVDPYPWLTANTN